MKKQNTNFIYYILSVQKGISVFSVVCYRWLNLRKFFTLAPISQKRCLYTLSWASFLKMDSAQLRTAVIWHLFGKIGAEMKNFLRLIHLFSKAVFAPNNWRQKIPAITFRRFRGRGSHVSKAKPIYIITDVFAYWLLL